VPHADAKNMKEIHLKSSKHMVSCGAVFACEFSHSKAKKSIRFWMFG